MTQVDLIKKYQLSIQGKLGQHLLIDPNVARKIVDAVEAGPGQTILEVGPGLGALTEWLLQSGCRVLAVEKDRRFANVLKEEYGSKYGEQLEVVQRDFLDFDLHAEFAKRAQAPRKVISNLPYYVTAPVLFEIFEKSALFTDAVFMMQREVAERIVAPAGTREYGRLSVGAAYFSTPRHIMEVSPSCFTPQPEVKSSVMAFKFKPQKNRLPEAAEKNFLDLVRRGFSQRRKTLLGLLVNRQQAWTRAALQEIFRSCGLDLSIRAERLSLEDFLRLFRTLPA